MQLDISNLVQSAWVSLVLPHQSLGEMATNDELEAETMPPPSDPVFNVGDIVVLKYSSYNIGEQYRVESFADDGEGPTCYCLIPELAKYRCIIRTGDVLAHASTNVSINTGAEVPSLCPQEPQAKRLLVRMFKIEDLEPSDIVKTVLYALGVEPKKGDKLLFYEYHKAGLGANFEHLAEDGDRLYGRILPVRSVAEANRLDGRVDGQSPPVHDDKKELHKRMRFGVLSLLHGMHDRSKLSEPLLSRLQTLGISKKTDMSSRKINPFPMSGPPEYKAEQNPSTTAQPAEPKLSAMADKTTSTSNEDEAPAEPECSAMTVVTKSTEEEDEAPSAKPGLSAMAVETTSTKDANEEEEDEDDLVFVGRGAWKSRSHVSQDQCTFS